MRHALLRFGRNLVAFATPEFLARPGSLRHDATFSDRLVELNKQELIALAKKRTRCEERNVQDAEALGAEGLSCPAEAFELFQNRLTNERVDDILQLLELLGL